MERRAKRTADRKGRAITAHFIEPMKCLAVSKLPTGPAWAYELKFDGYRAIAFKTSDRIHLKSRNGKDFAKRYPALVRALEALPDETVIDGEIVALDDSGRPSFNLLQNYASREYTLVFYLFDLLILEGEDLQIESLEVRRKLLSTRVMPRLAEPIRFSETIQASASELLRVMMASSRRREERAVLSKHWINTRTMRSLELSAGFPNSKKPPKNFSRSEPTRSI